MENSKEVENLEKQLEKLKEWVIKQPHVAKDMDDKLLRRFLHSCYYDTEKAQKAIEAFCSMRADAPEMFCGRGPLEPRLHQALKYTNFAFVPISGNRRLWILQINDPGFHNFDHPEFQRLVLMAFDAWMLDDGNLQEEDITIFDAKDISLKIFWRMHFSLQKKMIRYQEEAMPLRIKGMHMINAPSFIDKLFGLMKPFMSKELADMVHFHVPKSETLFQYFSKDDLPKDFGGNLNSLADYQQETVEVINKHSDALTRDDLWMTPKK